MSLSVSGYGAPFTGRRFFLILAVCFAVIFAVNGVMAYLAISTFSGVDGDDSYRAGLEYNTTLARARRQASLGWSVTLSGLPGRKGLQLQLADKAGAPLHGLTIAGTLGRPSTDRFDRPIVLREIEPGRYQADFTADAGTWVAILTAAPAAGLTGGEPYQIKQRIWLK